MENPEIQTLSITVNLRTGKMDVALPINTVMTAGLLMLLTEYTRANRILPEVMPRITPAPPGMVV